MTIQIVGINQANLQLFVNAQFRVGRVRQACVQEERELVLAAFEGIATILGVFRDSQMLAERNDVRVLSLQLISSDV